MSPEPGQDAVAFQGLRTWFRGVTEDPVKLRVYSHLALVLLGWFGMLSPLADRLAKARTTLEKSHKNEQRATAHVQLVEARDRYLPRVTGSDDLLDWQSFLLSKIDAAGVRLVACEPYKPDKRGVFQVMRFNVNVMSYDYQALTDFIDRLEHGERLVRLESLVVTQTNQSILLTFMLRGLVKIGLPTIPLQDQLGASSGLDLALPDELLELPEGAPPVVVSDDVLALLDGASPLDGDPAADEGSPAPPDDGQDSGSGL